MISNILLENYNLINSININNNILLDYDSIINNLDNISEKIYSKKPLDKLNFKLLLNDKKEILYLNLINNLDNISEKIYSEKPLDKLNFKLLLNDKKEILYLNLNNNLQNNNKKEVLNLNNNVNKEDSNFLITNDINNNLMNISSSSNETEEDIILRLNGANLCLNIKADYYKGKMTKDHLNTILDLDNYFELFLNSDNNSFNEKNIEYMLKDLKLSLKSSLIYNFIRAEPDIIAVSFVPDLNTFKINEIIHKDNNKNTSKIFRIPLVVENKINLYNKKSFFFLYLEKITYSSDIERWKFLYNILYLYHHKNNHRFLIFSNLFNIDTFKNLKDTVTKEKIVINLYDIYNAGLNKEEILEFIEFEQFLDKKNFYEINRTLEAYTYSLGESYNDEVCKRLYNELILRLILKKGYEINMK